MRQSQAVSSLFKEGILFSPENISSSLLGYLFFREKLIETVLGDSEVHILYWVGKEMGSSMDVKIIEEVEDIFFQLDLGAVQIEHCSPSLITLRITHNRFRLIPIQRLQKTMNLEAGLIAGIIEKITGTYCAASLTITEKNGVSAIIEVAIDKQAV